MHYTIARDLETQHLRPFEQTGKASHSPTKRTETESSLGKRPAADKPMKSEETVQSADSDPTQHTNYVPLRKFQFDWHLSSAGGIERVTNCFTGPEDRGCAAQLWLGRPNTRANWSRQKDRAGDGKTWAHE